MNSPESVKPVITYDTSPEQYKHWKLACDGAIATLTLDIQEDRGIKPGYKLKLNSYDLGVDMELHDAVQRIRFEHPEVKHRGHHQRQGAHVLLRRQHLHARPVDPRLEGELLQVHQRDAQRPRGFQRTLRPEVPRRLNGATAGGGYEMALACDEIAMIDDRSTAVSLPEVPLLGVLPGTGGLTRWWTSAGCAATWPTSSAPPPRACAPSGRRNGSWSTTSPSRSSSRRWSRRAPPNWPSCPTVPAARASP
jgi:benzoyl-CoA-dihydrodiol lyase